MDVKTISQTKPGKILGRRYNRSPTMLTTFGYRGVGHINFSRKLNFGLSSILQYPGFIKRCLYFLLDLSVLANEILYTDIENF